MNRKLLILSGSVVTVHLFLFFFNFKNEKVLPSPKKSIVVHTFVPRPKSKPKIVQQSQAPSKPVKKIEKTKGSASAKKTEILKELKESLTKIEIPEPEQKSVLTLPKNIQSLQIDQPEQTKKTDYFILLAQTLKEELELPEYGDVKLELTVLQSGRIQKLKVIAAKSEKNRKYLELNIPRIILPPFNDTLSNEREHTFILTFCNEN